MDTSVTKKDKPSSSRSITELTDYIQSLKGVERKNFCKTLSADEKKAYLKCLRDKEREKVKGIYRCFIPLGGSVTFSCKFHEGDVETYNFRDGEEYEVPLYVANHLRNNCWFPQHEYQMDGAGNKLIGIGKKHNTHSFEPSGFF